MERTFHMLLYRAFHAQRNYLRPCLNEIGLCPGQPKLITYLATNGPCRQRQLAEYLEVDPAAISRMLESLQKGGFVCLQEDDTNRRCKLVALTDRGREANALWRQNCGEIEEIMLQGFTRQEREQFADYLTRVRQNFTQWKEVHS